MRPADAADSAQARELDTRRGLAALEPWAEQEERARDAAQRLEAWRNADKAAGRLRVASAIEELERRFAK